MNIKITYKNCDIVINGFKLSQDGNGISLDYSIDKGCKSDPEMKKEIQKFLDDWLNNSLNLHKK